MSEKKTFKLPENYVGYVSKSKAGNIMITVEQDLALGKGDKLMHKKPLENLEGLLERGFIDQAKFDERAAQIPEWKLYEVTVMKTK
jgi:hypothetical protein